MKRYKIYSLADPITGDIKYIGSTTEELTERNRRHCRTTGRDYYVNIEKSKWVIYLKDKGLKPVIELIDTAEGESEMYRLEEFWTYMFKSWGFCLFNKYYGKIMDFATKQKMKEMKVGFKIPKHVLDASAEKRKKSVLQRNLQGEIIAWWPHVTEAERTFKTGDGKISHVCKKLGFTAGGYRWEYCSEETFNQMSKYVQIKIGSSLLASKGCGEGVILKKLS